jgi:hypothetical protein
MRPSFETRAQEGALLGMTGFEISVPIDVKDIN